MNPASVAQIAAWREHPARMVRDLWGAEPEPWQAQVLEAFPHNQRICMKASKGVGKTCLEAWLIWNFLLTRPHPKIAATAISGDNLADNLWTELALWQARSKLLSETFQWTQDKDRRESASGDVVVLGAHLGEERRQGSASKHTGRTAQRLYPVRA